MLFSSPNYNGQCPNDFHSMNICIKIPNKKESVSKWIIKHSIPMSLWVTYKNPSFTVIYKKFYVFGFDTILPLSIISLEFKYIVEMK